MSFNFYVNRTRDRHPYVTGPFVSFQAADAFAVKWIDPEEGSYSVTTHLHLKNAGFNFDDLIDPYHSAQIEAQKPHSSALRSGIKHIKQGEFDTWMLINAS